MCHSGRPTIDCLWNEPLGPAKSKNGSNWCRSGIISGGGKTNPLADTLEPPDLNASRSNSETQVQWTGLGDDPIQVLLANYEGGK
jgi:hypothetical protein